MKVLFVDANGFQRQMDVERLDPTIEIPRWCVCCQAIRGGNIPTSRRTV